MSLSIRRLCALTAGLLCFSVITIIARAEPSAPVQPAPMRPAVFDWSGPYGGLIFSVKSFEASLPGISASADRFDGRGRLAGIALGYNFVDGNWLWGLEADAGYGQLKAARRSDSLKADAMGSFRLRLGRKFDDTLIYSLAGITLAGTSYNSSLLTHGRTDTHVGLLFGAGIEQAITKRLSGRIEYAYGHPLSTSGPHFDNLHMIRAGAILHLPD